MIFQTWSREYADSISLYYIQNKFYYDIFEDQNQAQDSLNKVFNKIASELKIPVIPIGSIWQEINRQIPQLDLWIDDHSHPTKLGSIITAYAFYTAYFKELPTTNYLLEKYDKQTIDQIRSIIKEQIFTNL